MNSTVHPDDARFLELLERWMQGDFTRADEREMYALAATDDFRREAWEGFAALPEEGHGTRLAALRSRLHQRGSGGRQVTMVRWIAAAALMAGVLAALWFVPDWSTTPEQTAPLARTAPPAPVQPEEQFTGIDDSSLAVADNISTRAKSIRPQPARLQPRPSVAAAPADDLAMLTDEDVSEQKADEIQSPSPQAPLQTGGPLADTAPVRAADAQPMPVSTYPGGPAGNVAPYQGQTTVYNPTSAPKTEGSDKSTRRENAKKKSAAKAPTPKEPSATPLGGWEAFRSYLAQTTRLTAAARENKVNGYVRLQFLIGPDGRPADIQVLQSLGYGCDEEAIRLVSSVFWLSTGADPLILDVPFVQ